jgi:hypothetical protein
MSGIIRKKEPGEAWETVVDDGGSGGSGPILSASVDLTAAQLADLNGTPVEVVAAVAGKTIIPIGGSFAFTAGTVPFGGSGDGFQLYTETDNFLLHAVANLNVLDDYVGNFVYSTNSISTVAAALMVKAGETVGFAGPILTSSLETGGQLWAPGDTATVDGGGGDAVITVSTIANGFVVNQVNQGAKTFRLTGNATAFQAGDTLQVYRSTGNDGNYTIDTVGAFTGGNTLITLDAGDSIPDATADGRAGDFTLDAVGVILTYALTNPGEGYQVANEVDVAAVTPADGTGASVNILTVGEASDGTARVTVYYGLTDAV